MDEISTQQRIEGCLLTGAVGDALGGPIEFASTVDIRRHFGEDGLLELPTDRRGEAHITDDTQMTLFTAEGLIRAWARFEDRGFADVPTCVHGAYARWLVTQGEGWPSADIYPGHADGYLVGEEVLHARRAPGNTCLGALRSGRMGTVDAPLNDSMGCGGVMRAAPAGFCGDDPQAAFQKGVDAAVITHGSPGGYLPAGVLAAAVAGVLTGASLRDALEAAAELLPRWDGHESTLEHLRLGIDRSLDGLPSPEDLDGMAPAWASTTGWTGPDALGASVWCALGTDDVRAGLLAAVNHGGDSDSTGAIAGNLLGVAHGTAAIDDWVWLVDAAAVTARMATSCFLYLWSGESVVQPSVAVEDWMFPTW